MILFDTAAVWLIMLLLERRKLDSRWALLYALNPLTLYSFAGQGHFDVMQSFFLLGAILCYDRKKWFLMFVLAGLAVQTKYVAAAAVPFLIRRDNLKCLWILPVIIVIPYIPLIDSQWRQLYYCIVKFGEEYAFNGSIHGLLRAAAGSMAPATDICKVLLLRRVSGFSTRHGAAVSVMTRYRAAFSRSVHFCFLPRPCISGISHGSFRLPLSGRNFPG